MGRDLHWLEDDERPLDDAAAAVARAQARRMSVPTMLLDFAAPRVRTTLTGVVLLVVGVSAVALACLEYHSALP